MIPIPVIKSHSHQVQNAVLYSWNISKPYMAFIQWMPMSYPLIALYRRIEIRRKQNLVFFFLAEDAHCIIVCMNLVGLELLTPNRKPRPVSPSLPPLQAPVCCWWALIATNWGTSRASSMSLWGNKPAQKTNSTQTDFLFCCLIGQQITGLFEKWSWGFIFIIHLLFLSRHFTRIYLTIILLFNNDNNI